MHYSDALNLKQIVVVHNPVLYMIQRLRRSSFLPLRPMSGSSAVVSIALGAEASGRGYLFTSSLVVDVYKSLRN